MYTSTLRPGLLVSCKTSIRGNCNYDTTVIESEHLVGDMKRAKWETTKTVLDAKEHERALKVRSLARSAVQTVCAHSDFGLICPSDRADRLKDAIARARAICGDFNATARVTQVRFNVMVGEVKADDVEAVKAINGEIRDLMEAMANGLATLNVEAVRTAAIKARSVGKVLEANAQERVQKAIEVARAAARQIVKAGEEGEAEIDNVAIQRIVEARTSFLDIEETEIGTVETVGRSVDIERARSDETEARRAIAEAALRAVEGVSEEDEPEPFYDDEEPKDEPAPTTPGRNIDL